MTWLISNPITPSRRYSSGTSSVVVALDFGRPRSCAYLRDPVVLYFARYARLTASFRSFASGANGAYRYFAAADLHCASRFLEERAVPTARLDTPRADEDATIDHNDPDSNEPVWQHTCSNTQPLGFVDDRQGLSLKRRFDFKRATIGCLLYTFAAVCASRSEAPSHQRRVATTSTHRDRTPDERRS